MPRDMTGEEAAAVRSLRRLAKRWPRSLRLFAWNGSLRVMDSSMAPGEDAVVADVRGIPCDGGDP